MGRPFLSSIRHTSRSLHPLRYRLVLVIIFLALFQQQHLYFVHRQSLAAKYSSTIFASNSQELHPRLLRPDDEDSHFQDELLMNREAWKVLGEGWEGKVFTYKDLVIKTFTPGRSPFRNCAPGMTNKKWPTEIPASLRFGGFYQQADANEDNYGQNASTTNDGFLPVKAFFKASPLPSKPAEWHLVTPFVPGGNLNTFAGKLSTDTIARSFRDVDARYRPAFNRLLASMEGLHDAGYCHDDIKPANIFIRDDSHWVLGDLGNARHISHPYHSSRLWRNNDQLEDCRANDVIRALKSYFKFIQTSLDDDGDFNIALLEGKEPMSRLFWGTLAGATSMSAARLRQQSLIEYPEAPPKTDSNAGYSLLPHSYTLMYLFSRRLALKHAVNRTLLTRMGEKMARWWAMTWLFGVPISEVCGL
ncbi:Nn.00g066810.m01.CDS01 [Neocucurbitaria sp. VM-36]